jgi:Rha family phage regulatory protein
MQNELETVINLVEKEGNFFVSSKEVAKKFGKRHKNILRDIANMQVSENFRLLNFEPSVEKDSLGIDRKIFYMSRDGFSKLVFGFTGQAACEWQEKFLEAFNKMERYIKEQVPALQARVMQLEHEKNTLLLETPKKPHHLKNTVLIPVPVNTLFGTEIEYRRVPKDCDRYSDMAYKEGELKRLSSCINGMAKKLDCLTKDLARLRRI